MINKYFIGELSFFFFFFFFVLLSHIKSKVVPVLNKEDASCA